MCLVVAFDMTIILTIGFLILFSITRLYVCVCVFVCVFGTENWQRYPSPGQNGHHVGGQQTGRRLAAAVQNGLPERGGFGRRMFVVVAVTAAPGGRPPVIGGTRTQGRGRGRTGGVGRVERLRRRRPRTAFVRRSQRQRLQRLFVAGVFHGDSVARPAVRQTSVGHRRGNATRTGRTRPRRRRAPQCPRPFFTRSSTPPAVVHRRMRCHRLRTRPVRDEPVDLRRRTDGGERECKRRGGAQTQGTDTHSPDRRQFQKGRRFLETVNGVYSYFGKTFLRDHLLFPPSLLIFFFSRVVLIMCNNFNIAFYIRIRIEHKSRTPNNIIIVTHFSL